MIQGAPVESMQTEDHRYSLMECEPGIWMVLVMNNPSIPTIVVPPKGAQGGGRRSTKASKAPKTKMVTSAEYLNETNLRATMKRAYVEELRRERLPTGVLWWLHVCVRCAVCCMLRVVCCV